MGKFSTLVTTFVLASLAATSPIDGIRTTNAGTTAETLASEATIEDYIRIAGEIGNTKTIRASCEGQSCAIADLSGSTGNVPKIKPVGGDQNGYKCIAKYNPEGIQAVMNAPSGPVQPVGLSGMLTSALASLSSATSFLPPKDKGSFTGRCNKNILIFARGTTETGTLGITVGPVLNAGLSRDWTVVGVPYDADMAGDNCLGLPGGHVARDMINQAAEKCPDAKIFMSGYSEGGMVSHNGVAYANDEAKKHVAVSRSFRDYEQ
jgi:hypothetical protein